jgi:hypothetical protein
MPLRHNYADFDSTGRVRAVTNDMLEIPRGCISNMVSVNKFGRSTNVDSGVATDVWDRATSACAEAIWTAPTQARVHNIASLSASDDGSPVGSGARTVQIFGLLDWDTAEVSETLTLNGTNNVASASAYVIIHRMKILTSGSLGPNASPIKATAVTDGTVTAQINSGAGQTQMAIYGIPSTQTAYMTGFYGSVLRASLGVNEQHVDMSLLYNPEPGDNANTYLVKHTTGAGTRAQSPFRHPYNPYKTFAGPGILKLQAIGSANDLDVSAGFDLVLVDN